MQPDGVNLFIFQTIINWSKMIDSLKCLRSPTLKCKEIGIRKSEFVTKTQFLYDQALISISTILKFPAQKSQFKIIKLSWKHLQNFCSYECVGNINGNRTSRSAFPLYVYICLHSLYTSTFVYFPLIRIILLHSLYTSTFVYFPFIRLQFVYIPFKDLRGIKAEL